MPLDQSPAGRRRRPGQDCSHAAGVDGRRPYAFCSEIEVDAAAAFDTAGLAAFEKQVRARFEAASKEPSGYPYRQWSGVLRAIYCAQRDIQAYIALAEQTGLKPE